MACPVDRGCLFYRQSVAPYLRGGDEARGAEHQVRPPDGGVRLSGQPHRVIQSRQSTVSPSLSQSKRYGHLEDKSVNVNEKEVYYEVYY